MNDTESARPSGRPRKFDADAGVETAMRLFWERGYDGVGVAELARSIGINPPSFYAAYGSKLDLFRRAVDRYGDTHGAFFARLFEEGSLAAVLGAVLADALEVYSGDPACKGCLVMDGTRNCADTDARAVTGARRDWLRQTVTSLAAAQGVLRPDAVGDYFMFLLAGLSASARDGAAREELSQDLALAMTGLHELIAEPA